MGLLPAQSSCSRLLPSTLCVLRHAMQHLGLPTDCMLCPTHTAAVLRPCVLRAHFTVLICALEPVRRQHSCAAMLMSCVLCTLHPAVQHLDLSTDYTQYKAYAYSAPTLVDINMDGKLEILLGTSVVGGRGRLGAQRDAG
jgi:hypothetical protein